MSTIGQEIGQAEQKADKWYLRLEKQPLLFLLAFTLGLLVWREITNKELRRELRQDYKELKQELAQERTEHKVTQREKAFAIEKAGMAQDKTIALYERIYGVTPQR